MKLFFKNIKQNFIEWEVNGFCKEAKNLNSLVGEEYFCVSNPHFFTGKFDSELVLVHLNPKRNKDKFTNSFKLSKPSECGFNSLEDYLNYYQNFGKINYGSNSSRKHKSPFDHKQIRFLNPLKILPFSTTDIYYNLETVIDAKLQIELIPYGSEDFDYNKVGIDNIKPFIDRVLDLISSSSRMYVIFCGAVFDKVLKQYVIEKKSHLFKLIKKDGTLTLNYFELINIKLQYNNKIISCAVAPQFAKQGYPVEEYGKKIKQLYGVF